MVAIPRHVDRLSIKDIANDGTGRCGGQGKIYPKRKSTWIQTKSCAKEGNSKTKRKNKTSWDTVYLGQTYTAMYQTGNGTNLLRLSMSLKIAMDFVLTAL